jgi:large repetitive protein
MATVASGPGYREWTVTAVVEAMYAGSNHGFMIRDSLDTGGGPQGFDSREATGNRPQLVVTFE